MDSRLHQQLWELHHDLLPDAEAAELRARLAQEPELSAAWARIQQEVGLVAQAARIDGPPLGLRISEQQAVRPISAAVRPVEGRKGAVRHAERNNRWSWAIALAAGVMFLLSLGGYQFHRARLARLDRELPRVVVSGPARLTAGAVNRFSVQLTSMTGDPLAMHMVYALYDADRETRLQLHRHETDRLGRMSIEVSAKEQLPERCELRLAVAQRGLEAPLVKLSLPSAPDSLRTLLTTDRPSYAPGDVVRFRSVTLRQADLKPADVAELQYQALDPAGVPVSGSAVTSAAPLGVGSGEFTLPADIPLGEYRLVASADASPGASAERRFLVTPPPADDYNAEFAFAQSSFAGGEEVRSQVLFRDAAGAPAAGAPVELFAEAEGQELWRGNAWLDQSGAATARFALPPALRGPAKLTAVADLGGEQAVASAEVPLAADGLDVRFYPEGGDLVAGVENRVYFSVHDRLGRPRELSGEIVDDQRHVLSEANTRFAGRGVFRVSPQAGRTYRLHLEGADEPSAWPSLPQVRSDRALALSVPSPVINPAEPVEVVIHDRRGATPLVMAAYCRGRQVGQTALITTAGRNQAKVDPGKDADGVLRLTLLDCTASPPKPVAERLVYRLPSRKLRIELGGLKDNVYLPEETAEIQANVSDESARPVAGAVLGVAVADAALDSPVHESRPGIDAYFRLASQVDRPEDLDFATLDVNDSAASREALDLLLGTQGWRRLVESTPEMLAQQQAATPDAVAAVASGDLLVWDNLTEVRPRYEQRAQQLWGEQAQLLAVLTICGGVGLALALVMAILWRLVGSLEWSLPSLAAAAGCVAIGVLLARGGQRTPSATTAVAFADSLSPLEVAAVVEDRAAPPREAAAESPPRAEDETRVLGKGGAMLEKGGAPTNETDSDYSVPPPPAPTPATSDAPAAPAQVIEESATRQTLSGPVQQRAAQAAPAPKAEMDAMYKGHLDRPALKQVARAMVLREQPVDPSLGANYDDRIGKALVNSTRHHYRAPADDEGRRRSKTAAEQDPSPAAAERPFEEAERLSEAVPPRAQEPDAKDAAYYREFAYSPSPVATPGSRRAPAVLYWHAFAVTDEEGKATLTFNVGPAEAEYDLRLDAHDANGRLAAARRTLRVDYPVMLAQEFPAGLTAGDRYDLPVRLENSTKEPQAVEMKLHVDDAIDADTAEMNVELRPEERKQLYVSIQADRIASRAALGLEGNTATSNSMIFNELVSQSLEVTPNGYPVVETHAGWLVGEREVNLRIPEAAVPGSLTVTCWLYPGMLAEWEHARSYLATLPRRNLNTQLALAQVNARLGDPAYGAEVLARYAFAPSQSGQFGTPGQAATSWENFWSWGDLARYANDTRGLATYDAQQVPTDGSQSRYARGGSQYLTFGRPQSWDAGPDDSTRHFGYPGLGLTPPEFALAWSFANSSTTRNNQDFLPQLKQAEELALKRNDPISAGVVANGLSQAGDAASSEPLLERLAAWQRGDGGVSTPLESNVPAGSAAPSTVANTAVAALAWFTSPAHQDQAKRAVTWLASQRRGGGFGSADDTYLALRAGEVHAERGYREFAAGDVLLTSGEEVLARQTLSADRPGLASLVIDAAQLPPGDHRLQLTSTSPHPLPYALEVRYYATSPAGDPDLPLSLATRFNTEQATLERQITLQVDVTNRGDTPQDYVTAEIGLPAGVEPILATLEERRAAAEIDHFETRPRAIVPYWRRVEPQQTRSVEFGLRTVAPGEFTGPASSVYRLAAPQSRQWAAPLRIEVQQPAATANP